MTTAARARHAAILSAAALVLLLAPLPAAAQDAAVSIPPLPEAKPERRQMGLSDADKAGLSTEEARGLYQQHERQLDRLQSERKDVETDLSTIEAERVKLNARLLEAARKSADSEARLTALEAEMETLKGQEAEIREQLQKQYREIGDLFAIMQRMGREPPPVMVTQRDDALAMVRSGMVLNSFFPALKGRADTLSARLSDLMRLLVEKRRRAEDLAKEKRELESLRERTQQLIAEKQERLRRERSRLVQLDRAAERHAAAISDLSELLKTLDSEVAAQTGLGAYERELDSGGIVELKPRAKQAAFVQPGRLKPAVPFAQAKGLLLMPASGPVVRRFGDSDDLGITSKGIRIETRERAQVVSPADGWVSYAGPFRSYGQVLIINAGGGYHILLVGMEEIHVTQGQFVLSGEPVATMGSKPSGQGRSGNAAKPSLYVEFRKDQKPINPQPWWAAGLREG